MVKMKRIVYTTLLFAFCFSTFADEKMLSLCEDQAHSFGDGRGKSKIQATCINAYKTAAGQTAIKKSSDGLMTVFGHRNIIFIERPDKASGIRTDVLAGQSTTLEAATALSIDEKNNEIAVLEKSGDILFFSSQITGNVAPYRVIKSQDLYGSTELAVDSINDQIIVVNNSKNSILFYSRLANVYAREEKKNLKLLKAIKDTSGSLSDLNVDLKNQEFSVTDQISKKIITYKLIK